MASERVCWQNISALMHFHRLNVTLNLSPRLRAELAAATHSITPPLCVSVFCEQRRPFSRSRRDLICTAAAETDAARARGRARGRARVDRIPSA